MNSGQAPGEIEHRWNDGGGHNRCVWDAKQFGHNKRASSHDWGHDLSASRGDGLDGSGKGGVAAAIQKELGIAPRYLGTGEEPDRFERFQRERFVENIL